MPDAKFFADALAAWQRGQRDEAERQVRLALARNPHRLDSHRLLVEVLSAGAHPAQALAAARTLVNLAPHDAPAFRRLAELLGAAGEPAAAVSALETALRLEPDHPRALNNLGRFLTTLDQTAKAIAVLERALAVQPAYPAALVNLGVARSRAGELPQAILHYRRALELNTRLPEAWSNLAGALARTGDQGAALEACERLAALTGPTPATLCTRGDTLLTLRRHEDALATYEAVLQRAPSHAQAHLGRIRALLALDRPAVALAAADKVLLDSPAQPAAQGLRSAALLGLGRPLDAFEAAEVALTTDPNDVQARLSLGHAALRLDRARDALAAFDAAVLLAPQLSRAHAGRASALETLGEPDAIDAYERAIALEPEDRPTRLKAGLMMLRLGLGSRALEQFDALLAAEPGDTGVQEARAMALVALGRHDAALAAFTALERVAPQLDYLPGYVLSMKLWCGDWSDYEARRADIARRVAARERVEVPLSFLAHGDDPQLQRICGEVFVAQHCTIDEAVPPALWAGTDARLRIGYMSFDFRNHPVAQLLAGVLESHDRNRVEVFGICTAHDDGSELRRRLARSFDRFDDVSALPDEALARYIRGLELDVLIDLGGHTLGSRPRVLARRPAPLQVSFLGYPATFAADYVDYIVADQHVIPESERVHYSEQVIYLPDSYLPMDFPRPVAALPSRREAGLEDHWVVFCCFNSAFKYTPGVFASWMNVLRAVPEGVLWLRDGSATLRQRLAQAASEHGIAPERLIYAPRVPTNDEHLARFALADLFLDTTPYNAHTTASESLGVGVPVITRRCRSFASRVATSLLHAVDLGQLSVETLAQYESLAIGLAQQPSELAKLKSHLRAVRHSAPLFDTTRYCRNLERALVEIVARGRSGISTGPVYVDRLQAATAR